MMNVERILFPTDFSACAEDAFSHAAHLATRYDAEVHVFNVVTPDEAEQSNPMDYLPLTEAEDGGHFFAPGEQVDVETPDRESKSVSVVYSQIQSVSPAQAIVDHATSQDVDIVVMGTHGRRGMERLLSGSVSEEVVRQAPCPVFTVLAGDEPSPGPYVDRVVAPVDLSDQSALVADHARELAAAYDASLDLLHVVEQAAYPSAYGVDPLAPALSEVQDQAREAMEELAARAEGLAHPVRTHVLTGYAARDIVEFAEEKEAGLIVMATHGRTGLERFLIGSVAEKVVRRAKCPVFTVKSFGRSLVGDATVEAEAGDAPDESAE
jgi:nucleotide-binding universal stress UspA family protein